MVNPKQFGPFEIIRKLGRGMTDVYLAFDTRHNRRVVLKIVEESADSRASSWRPSAAARPCRNSFTSSIRAFIEIYE